MLYATRLRVVYNHDKTCFAYVNVVYSSANEQTQCVQVLQGDRLILLWIVFTNNVPEGHMACNPIFSRLVGLDESAEVIVSPYTNAKILDELYIESDSPDDQEILEQNTELLQLNILDQLRFVAANQRAIIWISVSMPIIFTPKQTGILVNHSKIIVKVDAFNSLRGFNQITPDAVVTDESTIQKFGNLGVIHNAMLKSYFIHPEVLVLRALPIDSDGKKNLVHPYTVFLHEFMKRREFKLSLGYMELVPSVIADNKSEDPEYKIKCKGICVEIIYIDHLIFKSLSREIYNKHIQTVLIPKSLNTIIKADKGSKIMLSLIDKPLKEPDHIEIITYSDMKENDKDISEYFKKYVTDNTNSGKKFIINNGVIKQSHIFSGYIQYNLKPDDLTYTVLNSESFRNCTVAVKFESKIDSTKRIIENDDYDFVDICNSIQCMEDIAREIILNISFEINREASFKNCSEIKGNVILTGLTGSGKSYLCKLIANKLTVWSHTIHCRLLKGRKDIPEILGKALLLCQEHSPSVLICDDIDSLVPPNLEGASPQDLAYYQRLAVVVKNLLQTCSGVCVLMTALCLQSMHHTLKQFTGRPLFTAHFRMPELNQAERVEFIKYTLSERIRDEIVIADEDILRMAINTTGHSIRELRDYVNKKIFAALKQTDSNMEKPRLLEALTNDCDRIDPFDVFTPIGGMEMVKQELIEVIFWPQLVCCYLIMISYRGHPETV